jgi:peptide-methionine (S)-S-oxide reductase
VRPHRPYIQSNAQEARMFFIDRRKMEMVTPDHALPGRPDPLPTAETHFVNGLPLKSPVPEGMEEAMFGMGCFWGVERIFWQIPGPSGQ